MTATGLTDAVDAVQHAGWLILTELLEGASLDDVQQATAAHYTVELGE